MEKGRKGGSEYFDRQSDPKNQTSLTPLIPFDSFSRAFLIVSWVECWQIGLQKPSDLYR